MAEPRPDLMVTGGTVIDGTGTARRRADVAVAGGRVTAIGDLSGVAARQRIDAQGLIVAPGFIDLLGHSYYALLVDPGAHSKVLQGVTLEVTGERLGVAPVLGAARELVRREGLVPLGLTADWSDMDGYAALLGGTAMNVACVVPAPLLRACVADPWIPGPLGPRGLARMCALLSDTLAQGAVGLTFVFEEAPCCYLGDAELRALLRVVRDHDALVMMHLRDEGADILAAVDEALDLLRASGTRGEILHVKVLGAPNWPLLPAVLERIERARADGVDVQANAYPYTAAGLALQQLVPGLVRRSPAAVAARLRADPAARSRLAEELRRPDLAPVWDGARQAVVAPGTAAPSISEWAAAEGTTPDALALELLTHAEDWVHLSVESIEDAGLDAAYRRPWMGAVSDGSSRHPGLPVLAGGPVHPREYGTFPRFLRRFARERRVLSEEDAVHRITGRAADRLGFADRGRLRPGAVADLVCYDPARFTDRATTSEPNRPAEGMRWVVVDGEVVLRQGKPTGALPGGVVRHEGRRGR